MPRATTASADSSAPANDPNTPPPIRLHCADALTTDFPPEARSERAKVVMQSAPRMPALAFFGGHYGDRWHVDMVALSHNAVRRQLFDAFVMANALGKLQLDVAEPDLARVFAWFGTLDEFVTAVFDVEDRFLYPLVDHHVKNARTSDGQPVYLPELLSVRGRRAAKEQVLQLLSVARKTRDVATGETPAKINALRYALDQFGANILDYFAAMERFFPKLLKKAVRNGEREKNKTERKLFDHVLKLPHGAVLAALLMQCIESRTQRRDFLERNLKKESLRTKFKADVKRVENTHMMLATTFDKLALQYERRFNVQTFVEHYDASGDAKETAALFGDMDINYDGPSKITVPAPGTNGGAASASDWADAQGGREDGAGAGGGAVGNDDDDDSDDDVIEVQVEVPISEAHQQA